MRRKQENARTKRLALLLLRWRIRVTRDFGQEGNSVALAPPPLLALRGGKEVPHYPLTHMRTEGYGAFNPSESKTRVLKVTGSRPKPCQIQA